MKYKKLLATGAMAAATSTVKYVHSYNAWKLQEMARLETESSIIETALGPIEYRIQGEGPAVLIVHGSPGGYDQGFGFARLIASQKFTFIAVSRPGYLRTPLHIGKSPEEQADLYASLLDALHIQQTAIIGISGGGPSALQFVLRHPDRCRGLVMMSAVAQRYSEEEVKQNFPLGKRLLNQLYNKAIVFDPVLYALIALEKMHPEAKSNPDTTTAFIDLLRSLSMYHLRKIGYDNDVEQFAAMPIYPLEDIVVSMFVVQGTADEEVPFADAELLVSKVPHAQLLALEGGSHTAFVTREETVMPALHQFLEAL